MGSASSRSTTIVVGAAGVAMVAVMGRAVIGLVVALIISYILSSRSIGAGQRRAALPAYIVAIGVQIAHLVEEYQTGFYRDFPPVLGATPWSRESFLLFNLSWLLVFALAIPGLLRGWRLAVMIALFLAIGGGILNGLAHLALAGIVGGYFPGLYTAPLVLCAGGYLAYRLFSRTNSAHQHPAHQAHHARSSSQ